MTSMWSGVSGLKLSQAALNTTGHNLANVDTVGFVRQQILGTDSAYRTIGKSYNNAMQVGGGTNMAAIRQVRDVFYDKAYRLEIGRQGFYESQAGAVEELENMFGELEGEQFQDTISDFWTAISELAKEPDSIVKRQMFISVGETFLSRTENLSQQLRSYQETLNIQINKQVNRINQIADEIKELNTAIMKYESGGQHANDYRDTRNNLLDELGKMASITYKEDNRGRVIVNLEGVRFIDDNYVFKMETQPVNDMSFMLKPVWVGNGCGDVFDLDTKYTTANNTDVGSLKGLLVARGDTVANYTMIPKKSDFTDENGTFNEYAYDKAVSKYNVDINQSVIMSIQAQFDQLVNGIMTTINDALSPNADVDTYFEHLGIKQSNGTTPTITVDGKVLTEEEMKDILVWDEGTSPMGMDKENTVREGLFNRKGMDRYTKASITYEEELSDGTKQTVEKDIWIYNQEDPSDIYTLFTPQQVEMNPKILNNPSILALSSSGQGGGTDAYDIKTCEKLLETWKSEFSTLDPNTETKHNFMEYYDAMIGALANRGKVVNDITESQAGLVNEIDTARQSVAGVSSDEELTNLVKFQHAYNANARYINVIDQMLDHIINRLG